MLFVLCADGLVVGRPRTVKDDLPLQSLLIVLISCGYEDARLFVVRCLLFVLSVKNVMNAITISSCYVCKAERDNGQAESTNMSKHLFLTYSYPCWC